MGIVQTDLGRLIDINVQQVRDAEDEAAGWDGRADWIGGVALVTAVVIVGTLVWYLLTQAFRPVFLLADAIDHFARGDEHARASEIGPAELREIAVRFNMMADALARQREDRLAFLSGVAHDLRNPLNVLSMGVELIEAEPDEARRREMLQRVRRQVGRLERMTSDFIDAAQIESGRVTLEPRRVDAGALAARSAEFFAGTTSHRIELDLPREELPIVCDPYRFEQVLVNLISNAIKYSPQGGRVRVSVDRVDGGVVFSVSDEGIGMTPQEAAVVFEPFRRTGRLQAEIPGAGLGLSIVRRIVDAHGGRITVTSEPGQGSKFAVRVPIGIPPGDDGQTSSGAETAAVPVPRS
jgi:signal transduction histidine kinase